MAKKMLVTTDFSANSKAGIRFAMQLASQANYSLVFYHCLPYLKPTRWTDAQYDDYAEAERKNTANQMERFVMDIAGRSGAKLPRFRWVVEHRTDTTQAIVEYARKIKAIAICMSTRGAGRLKKLIGNHASEIIQSSTLPVFVVPGTYRRSRLNHILYASDLNNISSELKKVRDLARSLKAKVSVFHYDYLADVPEALRKLEKSVQRYHYPGITFKFQKFNIAKSLAQHLLKDLRASKASLAVLFTNQKRPWFDKLFLSSKSVDVAFVSRAPLLVMPKA